MDEVDRSVPWPERTVEGTAFRLRPVTPADAEFIFALRSDPKLTRFLQDGARTIEDQRRWQEVQALKPHDSYFIVERLHDTQPMGTIALYNYDAAAASAEWGRWILRPGSLAAPESTYLIYHYGLELLGLDYVYGRTNLENVLTVSFHDGSGIPRQGTRLSTLIFRGESRQISGVEHGCRREDWPDTRSHLETIRQQCARMVQRSQQRTAPRC